MQVIYDEQYINNIKYLTTIDITIVDNEYYDLPIAILNFENLKH